MTMLRSQNIFIKNEYLIAINSPHAYHLYGDVGMWLAIRPVTIFLSGEQVSVRFDWKRRMWVEAIIKTSIK